MGVLAGTLPVALLGWARTVAGRTPPAPMAARPEPPPSIEGLTLDMPLEAASRAARALAPEGSVTLPAVRRESFFVVTIEAPAALAVPPPVNDDPKRDSNFYLMLNAAPRILRNQPTRSSHVAFITLVADKARRLVRIVFEPAHVHWPQGFDAADLPPAQFLEMLRDAYAPSARLFEPPGTPEPRPRKEPIGTAYWELRVNAERKSVVLTAPGRLPDELASRLQLD